ncbi:MAG: ATP-binding cassette domain-containing protein [Clostridia bacterium]|nr:ATP-binding cassette domain-containing protein [Clostridia bacterium]
MLELKEIKKHYSLGEVKQQVLKGINLKFRKSEFTSILGASGSGKTTLLNIIGGLDKYDSGDLIIEGVSTKQYLSRDWDAYRNHRVGFIFQSYNLISHQSVLSNVEMALTLSGVGKLKRRKKAVEALTKVGLKEHIHKRPNQLSGGQMQRVAIARALVNDPEIILADEPTGALDSETSVQIMELLKEIAKDKLVIMVTHNPELAKQYSTRIIELKDGLILNDSNPCNEEFKETSSKTMKKTSMSIFTSLGLSFKNLLTKKGRTFLTAFAGSIGIIGIALILALSNGVSNYVKDMERDSMSDYPIAIEKTSINLDEMLASSLNSNNNKKEGKDGELVSDDDISKEFKQSSANVVKHNDTKAFKKYIEKNQKDFEKYTSAIQYKYNIDLNIYNKSGNSYVKVNPNEFDIYAKSTNRTSGSSSALGISNKKELENVFEELLDDEKIIEDKYNVVAGRLPKEYNELILVINKDNTIPDSLLYTLGIKDRTDLKDIIQKLREKKDVKIEDKKYSYDDILKTSFKFILNTDYYKKENGSYIDYSKDQKYMNDVINKGVDLKIVGIMQVKNEDTKANYIGYTHYLTEYALKNIAQTDIYKEQINNEDYNVITNEEFDGVTSSYEDTCKKLGVIDIDEPNTINIYPKDFDSKQELIGLIDEYNKGKSDDDKITYSDLMKVMVDSITKIVKMVSALLIGFVAISLIVSSIMISIITYISVLERTKEIGILRAIGASKKDVTRVFKAETIIEGLLAGGLGVGIAVLITIPANIIVNKLAHIENIAKLPILYAVALILLSILLNVIAGLIPAKMAAKKDPVEALRNE